MEIQSIIFFKSGFTRFKAVEWLKKHGKRTDLEEKAHTFRARQKSPSEFEKSTFRTKEINDHIDFIIGKLNFFIWFMLSIVLNKFY